MPYIEVIHEDDAEGELFKVYDEIQTSRGRIANVLRIMSQNAKILKAHLGVYMAVVFGKSPLSRRERELIAVVTSSANQCPYCVTHHSEAFNKYEKDVERTKQIGQDWTKANLEGRDLSLAEYAHNLTLDPGAGRKEAVEKLRADGFTDAEIHDATHVVGYFNYINRVVHGLGVELESDDDRDYDY